MFLNCAKTINKKNNNNNNHKLNNLLNKTEALKQKQPQQQIMLKYDEMYKE